MSGIITSELIGDQPAKFTSLAFAQTAEKAFRRPLIATALYQNINHIAILVDPTPELLVLPLHGDQDFVDLPCVA